MDRHCCRGAVCVIRSTRARMSSPTTHTNKQIPVSRRAKHFWTCVQIHDENLLFLFLQTDLSLSFYSLPLSESRLPAAAHMFPPLLLSIVSFTAFVAADCDKWKQSIQLWQKPRFKIIKKKKESASPACWWMWPAASWYMLFIFSQESSEP